MQRKTITKMKDIKLAAMKAAKMGELGKLDSLREEGFRIGMCINKEGLCDDERCYCHENDTRD